MDETDFDAFVLTQMPHFIAINYQQLLEAQGSQRQVKFVIHIYNLVLRVLTINLVSQYLYKDKKQVNDSQLNHLLYEKFLGHLTIEVWKETFFEVLRAYRDKAHRLFMPELYKAFGDISTPEGSKVERSFERLARATVEIQKENMMPKDEGGWKALAEELLDHLRHILRCLSFIGSYELIYILEQGEQSYSFELHKGLQIAIEYHQPLPQHVRLDVGRFYLRTNMEKFLLLHPLVVFWKGTIEPTDTGIFDRLVAEQLRYLSIIPDELKEDHEEYFEDFALWIKGEIEKRSRENPLSVERLTWEHLRTICTDITRQQMATVQDKYREELYLQREEAHQKFQRFLADPEKRGFILVGKSGVGKSNFFLSLENELRSKKDVCLLMYDGGNLRVAGSLTATISQDFNDRLVLSGQQIQQVWYEIARIEGVQYRQVILCVDAINENVEAVELLQQLDRLAQGPWPWLKIVFSSRMETWQGIMRQVKPASALYYREKKAEAPGVELESFNYSECLDPFSPQELPIVYARYQQTFQLKTPYETLSREVRETLQDPLNLWLVAQTYYGQAIPSVIKTSDLIEHYVSTLHVRTPLQGEDLRFLKDELVPLMVSRGHYKNTITRADIDAAGTALYNSVYSMQEIRNGQRMNDSFSRLVDVGILVRQEQKLDKRIAFKYERFYEYFVGGKIAELSVQEETDAKRVSFFVKLIAEAGEKPFLWGAVKSALVEEAKESGSDLLKQLCFTDQQRVKDMLVSVLLSLGQEDPQSVDSLLRSLMPEQKRPNELQKLRWLRGKLNESTDLRTRNARKIAIEVASNLGLDHILKNAALQRDPTMRALAVRYGYYLWQRNPAAGFAILDYIAEQATTGLLPNSAALESAVGMSGIIMCDHYRDKSVSDRLQSIWQMTLTRLLRISESSPWKRIIVDFVRNQIIEFAITIVFRYLHQLPDFNMVNYEAFKTFFQLGVAEKTLYKRLVSYLDINGKYSREQMEHDYLEAIKIDNVLVILITLVGLVAHACSAPLTFLPFLKKLFEETKRDVTTYPYLTVISNVVMEVLYRDPTIDEVFDFLVYTNNICQEYYAKHPEAAHNRHLAVSPQTAGTAPYIIFQYQRTGMVRTVWLETLIETALSQKNLTFFDFLLTMELPQVGLDLELPKAALEVVEIFFQRSLKAPLQQGDQSILTFIIAFLARLRVRYPDDVDDFLEAQKAPDDFRLQVRTNEPIEKVGDLVGKRSWFFLRDAIIMDSPTLRSQFQLLFTQAADSRNMRAWADYAIRTIANAICGKPVLRQLE